MPRPFLQFPHTTCPLWISSCKPNKRVMRTRNGEPNDACQRCTCPAQCYAARVNEERRGRRVGFGPTGVSWATGADQH
ncbi:hypothetical protein E2C01_063897 [Portunus trituberculatus]|uniref:Uncharacterized protein n=1 Tax=Portunus trituberculatus TaxID=210409 RepID=A0A5B7HLU0_PORTR|nr:hypothetical protein [Portunus trituberculatus]